MINTSTKKTHAKHSVLNTYDTNHADTEDLSQQDAFFRFKKHPRAAGSEGTREEERWRFFTFAKKIKLLPKLLTPKEQRTIRLLLLLVLIALMGLGASWYYAHSEVVPKRGG